jgi:hypothetical protein
MDMGGDECFAALVVDLGPELDPAVIFLAWPA